MLHAIWLQLVEFAGAITEASAALWAVIVSFFCSALSTVTASYKSGSAFNWLRKLISYLGLNFHRATNIDESHNVERISELEAEVQRLKDARLDTALSLANARAEKEQALKDVDVFKKQLEGMRRSNRSLKSANSRMSRANGKVK